MEWWSAVLKNHLLWGFSLYLVRAWFFGPAIPPVTGSYLVDIKIGGVAYLASTTIDATSKLPSVTGLTVTSASASSVSGSWSAVPGAQIYEVQIGNDTDKKEISKKYVTDTSAAFTGISIDPTKANLFVVRALAVNVNLPLTTPVTTQFNVSSERKPITF
jgi:hypothetical protein